MSGQRFSKPCSRRFMGLGLTAVLFYTTAVVACAGNDPISRMWQTWNLHNASWRLYSHGTTIDLMTERNHVAVYDMRRTPTLIRSFDVSGVNDLKAQYTCRPGNTSDIFELRSDDPKQTLRLNVDASSGVLVDARRQNLYEVESGSHVSMRFGDVVRFQRSGFSATSTPLSDALAVPASSLTAPIRVVIRPDLSSPLWHWEKRTAMQGYNGRYYLSAFHPAGVSTAELTAAIKRNPPSD